MMRSWYLLAPVVALCALSSCQSSSVLHDFDEDGSLDENDCGPSDPLVHPGACTATWSLTGSYTGPDTLSADFTATFTGSCGDCTNQSFPVTATR